jgi:hypothetical protein
MTNNRPTTNKQLTLPKFRSYEEEAAWFDTHDLAEYWHELEPVELDFQLDKPKEENIVVRLQKPVKDRLEQIARRKGLSISSLTRMLIMDLVQKSK